MRSEPTSIPTPRHIGPVNWLGVWTLFMKEVRRFVKVYTQTILAPVVTSMLFLAVFSLALGRAVETIGGVPFTQFLAPGLIMMVMVQNAFANTSSSIVISKVQGNIVDVLMPPLSAAELTVAYNAGGATRGLMVGLATTIAMRFFVPFGIHDFAFVLFHAVNEGVDDPNDLISLHFPRELPAWCVAIDEFVTP